MNFKGTVKPSTDLKKLFKNFESAEDLLFQAMDKAAIYLHREAQKKIQTITAGTTKYVRIPGRVRPVLHTVSAPGDAPNELSGRARKSIRIFREGKSKIQVGTELKYLAALEFDSVKNNRKARPWLAPTLREFAKTKLGQFFKIEIPKPKGGG